MRVSDNQAGKCPLRLPQSVSTRKHSEEGRDGKTASLGQCSTSSLVNSEGRSGSAVSSLHHSNDAKFTVLGNFGRAVMLQSPKYMDVNDVADSGTKVLRR